MLHISVGVGVEAKTCAAICLGRGYMHVLSYYRLPRTYNVSRVICKYGYRKIGLSVVAWQQQALFLSDVAQWLAVNVLFDNVLLVVVSSCLT